LGKSVAWRSYKQYKLYNGAIESQLILFDLVPENRFRDVAGSARLEHSPSNWRISNPERAEMFSNRLKKNLKSLGKWASKNKINCYRIYDADMPEFAIAVDIYLSEEQERWLHVQEYQAPKSVDEKSARERLSEALKVLGEFNFFGEEIKPERISLKVRSVKKGSSQYEKEASQKDFFNVFEGEACLKVNIKDYLDTGLFLDHRPIRKWIYDNASGKRFLNLFCYTGVATIQAALGGAKSTLSVDMSNTYLEWLEQNLKLNKLSLSDNKREQSDCIEWLKAKEGKESFDLIFLDPPSFSNSKRMQGVLDIQRDHVELIERCMSLLSKKGVLVFSNNLRRFKLSPEVGERYTLTDMTRASIDKDFERNSQIHQCWKIEH
jgi:23S rRNA (guanine2445-N2)-methyltransferase / 23S rRNA (guanine2069-N7)-methyltransferase